MEGKRPDEVNTWEYLEKHLWERAGQGGFSEDFVSLKAVLPALGGFDHLTNLLKALAEMGNRQFDNELIADLIKVYQNQYDLKPAAMEVLILVLWNDLTEIRGKGEHFATVYWRLCEQCAQLDPNQAGITNKLMEELKQKLM